MAFNKTDINAYLAGLNPVPSINAISAGTRAETTVIARANYLRAAYTALVGDPVEVDTRPRIESIIALGMIRAAIARSGRPLSPDALYVRDIALACFASLDSLQRQIECLLASGGAVSHEVKRLAGELVAELTSDGSSAFTIADGRGGIVFAPSDLDPSGNAEIEAALGV